VNLVAKSWQKASIASGKIFWKVFGKFSCTMCGKVDEIHFALSGKANVVENCSSK
jgi:hypothetical protein